MFLHRPITDCQLKCACKLHNSEKICLYGQNTCHVVSLGTFLNVPLFVVYTLGSNKTAKIICGKIDQYLKILKSIKFSYLNHISCCVVSLSQKWTSCLCILSNLQNVKHSYNIKFLSCFKENATRNTLLQNPLYIILPKFDYFIPRLCHDVIFIFLP